MKHDIIEGVEARVVGLRSRKKKVEAPVPRVARGRDSLEGHPTLRRAAQGWTPDVVFALGTLGDEMIGLLEALAILGTASSPKVIDHVGRLGTVVCRDLRKLEELGWVSRVGQVIDGRMCSVWRLTVSVR